VIECGFPVSDPRVPTCPVGAYRCSLRTGRVCETNSKTASFSSPPVPGGGRFAIFVVYYFPEAGVIQITNKR
jgi:hypothetical protein